MAVWQKPAALTLLALAAGCVSQGALPQPQIEYLGAGVLMVPVERDSTGCVRYRLLSQDSRPDDTVYWRIGEGYYTNNRANADCRPRPGANSRREQSRAF